MGGSGAGLLVTGPAHARPLLAASRMSLVAPEPSSQRLLASLAYLGGTGSGRMRVRLHLAGEGTLAAGAAHWSAG